MKFNIGDKVMPTDKNNGMYKEGLVYYSWYEVYKHENGIVDTYPEGNKEYSWAFSDSELQLIEQEQHNLIYTLRFDNPYETNLDGTRQNNTKEGLVEDFIDSLKALMVDSAKRGTFEIPEIKWEYTIIEQDTKEDTPKASCNKCIRPPYTSSKIDYDCEDCKISLFGKTVLDVEDVTSYHSHNQEPITDPRCGLDYEKEYKDLNEELYIAKTTIKMLSELI